MHVVDTNVYAVFDRVSGVLNPIFCATNDGVAVRYVLQNVAKYPKDLQILCIGSVHQEFPPVPLAEHQEVCLDFSDTSYFDFFELPRVVSFDAWRIPESKAEVLAPLGLSPDEVKEIVDNKIESMNMDTSVRG